MSKKVMIILGSPRKNANTDTLAKWVGQGAAEAGADIKFIDATKLKYKVNGCIACNSCQKSDKYVCVIKDEASDILAEMPQYDVLVFSTPIYFAGPSAQIKLLLDRMYSLFKMKEDKIENSLEDTTWALVATAADGHDGGLDTTQAMFQKITDFIKCDFKYLEQPFAPISLDEVGKDSELQQKAIQFGKDLVN
jgi:multimeric flavodoxin WrbA